MQVRTLGLLAMAALVAACGSSSGSAGPDGEDGAPFALRAVTSQAIAPEFLFSWLPYVLISGDGIVVRQGPVPAIFPGPLLPNLQGAALSDAGYDRIVDRARELGLLEGSGDFTPSTQLVGGLSGTIELRVDGALRELTGDPNANIECVTTPCDAVPGTPEAFGAFWREIGDLRSLVGDELGAEAAYHSEGFALLIGVTPPDGGGLQPQVAAWPLETPLADIGRPIGDTLLPRCGTVRGEDAAALEAAFGQANQLTRWVDEGDDPAEAVSIQVRPLLPGDGDICHDLFGITE